MSSTRRASLQKFLAAARSAVRAPASQRPLPLTLVVGNESADLDSICCAILYAHLRSASSAHAAAPLVPVANLPRADLSLRPELTLALAHAGLRPDDLITLSDLPCDGHDGSSQYRAEHGDPLRPADTRWILVDHNALTGPLARFAPHVVGCIDHHVDEGVVPRDADPRVIEPCGSCMSLVVDETRSAWDTLTGDNGSEGDEALAKLALAPVLIDIANLAAADKVKDKDKRSVDYLKAKLAACHPQPPYSRQAFYDELASVKRDISRLSFRDILRKDYKQWPQSGLKLGISSVIQGFEWLVDVKAAGKPDTLLDALSAWADERNLDLAAIMATAHLPDGSIQRYLLIWGRSDRGSAAVARFADQQTTPLRLHTWRGGELDTSQGSRLRFAWRQDESTASRKRIAPLLREAMADVETLA